MPSFSYICIIIAAVCLFIGFRTMLINSRNTGNRLFLAICIWIAALNILSVIAYSAKSSDEFILWTHFVTFFAHTFFPLNLHFYIHLFKRTRPSFLQISAIYLPPMFLMSVPLINYRNYFNVIFIEGKWKWIPETGSQWPYLYLILIFLYTALTILYLFKYAKQSKFNREKKLAGMLIINYSITIFAGIIFVGILPSFFKDMENIGLSYSLFYIVGLFFAVFRYGFLSFRSSFVAEEIISHISDIVILIDHDYRLVHYNKKFSDYFILGEKETRGGSIFDIISENTEFRRIIDDLSSTGTGSFTCRLDYIYGNETLPTDTYISVINDNFRDITGFIVLSKINRSRNLFKKTFTITDREFEVIDLVFSGMSNEEIGKKLGISERTVESHCLHIYNKTCTSDRLELFRKGAEYDLIMNKNIS